MYNQAWLSIHLVIQVVYLARTFDEILIYRRQLANHFCSLLAWLYLFREKRRRLVNLQIPCVTYYILHRRRRRRQGLWLSSPSSSSAWVCRHVRWAISSLSWISSLVHIIIQEGATFPFCRSCFFSNQPKVPCQAEKIES